jgi:hypothetical protein
MFRQQKFRFNHEILEGIRREISKPINSKQDERQKVTELFYTIKYAYLNKAVMPPLLNPDENSTLQLLFFKIKRDIQENREYVYARNMSINIWYELIRFREDDNSLARLQIQRLMTDIRENLKLEINGTIVEQLKKYSKDVKLNYPGLHVEIHRFILALKQVDQITLDDIIRTLRARIPNIRNEQEKLSYIRLRNVLTEYYNTYVELFTLADFKYNYQCLEYFFPRRIEKEQLKRCKDVFIELGLFVKEDQFTEDTYPNTRLTTIEKYREHVSDHTNELITFFKSCYVYGILTEICSIKNQQNRQITIEELYRVYDELLKKLDNISTYEFNGNHGEIEELLIDSISSSINMFRKKTIQVPQYINKEIQSLLYTICLLKDITNPDLLQQMEQAQVEITFAELINSLITENKVPVEYVEKCKKDMKETLQQYKINVERDIFNFENVSSLILSVNHHVYFVSIFIFQQFFESKRNNFPRTMATQIFSATSESITLLGVRNWLPYEIWRKIEGFLQPNKTQLERYVACKIQLFLRYFLTYETTLTSLVLTVSKFHKLIIVQ